MNIVGFLRFLLTAGRHRIVGIFALVNLLWLLPVQNVFAAPFDCVHNRCGIAIDVPYPNLVVGTLDGIATTAQAQEIFERAQKRGLWHLFPADDAAFAAKIKLVSVRVAPGRSLTVLTSPAETGLSSLELGQLVRFAPHRGLNEKPQPDNPYWAGIGCVIILCNTPNDAACDARYRPGLYRLDGTQLDASGHHEVPGGLVIDRFSMLPKTAAPSQPNGT